MTSGGGRCILVIMYTDKQKCYKICKDELCWLSVGTQPRNDICKFEGPLYFSPTRNFNPRPSASRHTPHPKASVYSDETNSITFCRGFAEVLYHYQMSASSGTGIGYIQCCILAFMP